MNREELEKFFDYILDKVEDCYKKEVESAVKEFLKVTALEVPVQEQQAWDCIAHFLSSLYNAMINNRKVDEEKEFPCITCMYLKECHCSPLQNFLVLKEKSDIEINFWIDKENL